MGVTRRARDRAPANAGKAAESPETALPAELGEIIGGYRLEQLLGRGAMGSVYLGVHSLLGRKAAIKILDPALAHDDEYVKRFFQEARLVNEVHHANIVDVIDFVRTDSPPRVAFVMEYIAGPTLGAVLRERRTTLAQALNVTSQLARALEAVHAVGIVHRDLKPANILILGSLDGDLAAVPSVKIVDFGIAKTASSAPGVRTATGMVLGTPVYMAPEQISADPVSGATDVYAIGEILYEMLSGERAFRGENMQVFRAKLALTPELAPLPLELPKRAELEALVRSCLATHPSARPSAGEVASVVEEMRAELPTESIAARAAPVWTRRAQPADTPTPLPFTQASALEMPKKSWTAFAALAAAGVLVCAAAAIAYMAIAGDPDAIVIEPREVPPVVVPVVPPATTPAPKVVEAPPPEKIEAPPPAEEKAVDPPVEKKSKKKSGPLKRELPSW